MTRHNPALACLTAMFLTLPLGCGALEHNERRPFSQTSSDAGSPGPDAMACDLVCVGFSDGQIVCSCKGSGVKPPCPLQKLTCVGRPDGPISCACAPNHALCTKGTITCHGDPDNGVVCDCSWLSLPCPPKKVVCFGHPDQGVVCTCRGSKPPCPPSQLVCQGDPDTGAVTCKCPTSGPHWIDGGAAPAADARPFPDQALPKVP